MELNSLYNLDYLDFFKKIHDNFCDLVCIDPPYFINYNKLEWDKIDKAEETFDNIFRESFRILKRKGTLIMFAGWSTLPIVFNSYKDHIGYQRLNNEPYFILKNSPIWDRIKGKNPGKKNFVSTREDILWFVKDEKEYVFNKEDSTIIKKTEGMGRKNGSKFRRLSNVWTDIPPIVPWSKEYLKYDCQKPLKLMRRVIRIFSNPEDIVIDYFCGCGSTLEACQIENRYFIGNDLNPEGIKKSKKRLNFC